MIFFQTPPPILFVSIVISLMPGFFNMRVAVLWLTNELVSRNIITILPCTMVDCSPVELYCCYERFS